MFHHNTKGISRRRVQKTSRWGHNENSCVENTAFAFCLSPAERRWPPRGIQYSPAHRGSRRSNSGVDCYKNRKKQTHAHDSNKLPHSISLLASLSPSLALVIFINSQMTEGAFNQQRARFTHSAKLRCGGGEVFTNFPAAAMRESRSGRSPFLLLHK